MHKLMHLDLAILLEKAVKKYIGIELNKKSFMYGNIKPDIAPHYFKIPHFVRSKSLDFVQEEINALAKEKNVHGTFCTKEFSQRLGIVTHYLSDFFCHAHSNNFSKSVITHYIYEIKLAIFFKKNKLMMNNLCHARSLDNLIDANSVLIFIENLRRSYLIVEPSYVLDITFTFKICLTFCLYVIKSCISDYMHEQEQL